MNEPVAESDNFAPRYLRVLRAFTDRRSAGRFTDDFEQSDQREIQLAIDIQIKPRVFPDAMASASRE